MTSTNGSSFRRLIKDARLGRASAVRQIVGHYTGALRNAVDRRIGARLQRRLDAEDILQSTFRSLFARLRREEYKLSSGTDLWKLLRTVALNKVRSKSRFHAAARRAVHRDRSPSDVDGVLAEFAAIGDGADPAIRAGLADEVEAFLKRLPEWARPLVQLRLEGLSSREIAQRTGRAERSVRRILARIEEQARAMAQTTGPVRVPAAKTA